jgi:hypothetical protein
MGGTRGGCRWCTAARCVDERFSMAVTQLSGARLVKLDKARQESVNQLQGAEGLLDNELLGVLDDTGRVVDGASGALQI